MKSSGWMFTDATNFVACPKCRQIPSSVCRTPKGRKLPYPHRERVEELRNRPDFREENYIRGGDGMPDENKKNRTEMKIEVGCDLGNLMLQAAKEMGCLGVTMGFAVASIYLRRIAERAIVLNDEELLRLCEKLALIKKD